MLSRTHRLPLRLKRQVVELEGADYSTPLFNLKVRKLLQTPPSPSLFSFIISRRISKRAVTRNLKKRQLAAALNSLHSHLKPNFEGIFYLKKAILDASYQTIDSELRSLLLRAHIL